MHIAIFTDYYLPTLGGIQTSIKAQKEALEGMGHRVTVFCPSHLLGNDKSIVRLPTLKYFKPDGYPVAGTTKKVIRCAKAEVRRLKDVDIIHVHSDMASGVAGLVVARDLGIPSVQTMHGREDVYAKKVLPLPDLYSLILIALHSRYISHDSTHIDESSAHAQTITARRMWRLMVSHANFADHVIVPSKHFAKKLKQHGVDRPLSIVSNGLEETVLIDLEDIKPRSYDAKSPLKIMWCGRVSAEKRPLEFLQSIQYLEIPIRVDMYGNGVDLKKVQQFIKLNHLESKVVAHGSVSQEIILQEMVNHHVLAYSSFDFDNQPMVLLEAIATGLPVIYCDPDLGETIPSAGSILSSSPDPSAIADSIQKTIKHPDSIRKMSEVMLRVRHGVAQKEQIERLVSVYRHTIKSSDYHTKAKR